MQHIRRPILSILENINRNMLEEKHNKPYNEITIKDMDSSDWKRFNDLLLFRRKNENS
jgi:hypothetical protein